MLLRTLDLLVVLGWSNFHVGQVGIVFLSDSIGDCGQFRVARIKFQFDSVETVGGLLTLGA